MTALFRHPLGLPIPHTAIVATGKARIGRILGNFVQAHFLSRDVIAAHLRAAGPAERAARWLSDPEHSRRIARQVAGGLGKTLEALPDDDARELVREVVSARLRATRIAPAFGRTLSLVLAGDRHQGLLNEAVRLAAEAVRDNRDVIREKVRAESPWWVPGVVDDQIYARIIGTVESLLRDIGANPGHPLRTAFDRALQDFVDRLQHAPDVIAKTEARQEIGELIAQTVAGWDPEATSRQFELAIGRDLQFVRINGTLVGGLVGLLIYALWHLWR